MIQKPEPAESIFSISPPYERSVINEFWAGTSDGVKVYAHALAVSINNKAYCTAPSKLPQESIEVNYYRKKF